MRRYILLSLLLCLKWTAWGQATYDYRYWFDSDDENQTTGTVATDNWHIDADLTGLTHTYHSIHFQVKDTAGVWSVPVTRHFVKLPDPKMKRGFFWFNDDVRKKTEIPVSAGEFQIDVSELENQLHHLHYIFLDDEENATSPLTAYFLKSADNRAEATYYYWTDNNSDNVKSGKCSGGVMMLDMSGEKDGFHVLHLLGGMDGDFSQPTTRMFIKVPQTEGVGSLSCLCYVDGELFKQESVPTSGGVVDWTLDVSLLSNGFHSIQVQVVTPSGAATSVHESFFFRTTMSGELGNMKLVYNVDGGEYKYQAGDFGTGVFHFDIDVSALKDGLHRLNYMLMSETGTSTKMSSSFFVKTPLGGPGVANYKYWINENEDDAVKVTLDERQELFKLIALLPVDPQPIRSKCFHFEIEEDGTPMMYAKNDFHIQFIDVKNYPRDATRQYIDYNVGQQIDDFTQLESGKRVYKVKSAENEVLWFCLDAETGDSLSFKLTKTATIQLFTQDGKEVYASSGNKSVVYSGINAPETGTYYVALHDVTGTKSSTIGLDYQKIDKYCVLNNIKSTWGVLPSSHLLRLYGNGYKQLESVMLEKDDISIEADSICIDDTHNCDILFNFTGHEDLGIYDLQLIFKEGETESRLTINKAITLQEPDFGNISVSVPNRSFLWNSNTIQIKVTNTSNLTYLCVPFNFAYSINQSAKFGNFDIAINGELAKNGLKSSMVINNFKGTGRRVRMYTAMIPCLKPHETIVYKIKLYTSAYYYFYAWIGTPWNLYATETMKYIQEIANNKYGAGNSGGGNNSGSSGGSSGGNGGSSGSSGSSGGSIGSGSSGGGVSSSGAIYLPGTYGGGAAAGNGTGNLMASCMPDPCEYGAIFGSQLAECNCAIAFNLGNVFGNIYLALKNRQTMAYRDAYGYSDEPLHHLMDPSEVWWNLADHCLPGKAGDVIAALDILREMMGEDPCPELPEFPISNPRSVDPNDILGYESPSGSKFMRNDIEDVSFKIRCENDPELATAPAHKVVITDTIDGNYYDLTSFTPTEVNIGGTILNLDGTETNFVKTLDLRTRLNVIAQVELKYNKSTGIAEWTMTALDPMTMEPTVDIMDGVLPVNIDGNGEGSVSFNIKQKGGFDDGTRISSIASIVFDTEKPIKTPVWTNTIDNTAPISRITEVVAVNDSLATIHIEAYDSLSGPWRYDLYSMTEQSDAWKKVASDVALDSTLLLKVDKETMYSYCTILTDSAGNVEQKELKAECVYSTFQLGDANSDGTIDAADVVLTISKYLGNDVLINTMAADVNRDGVIDAQDIVGIQQIFLESETLSRVNVHKQRIRLWQKQ